MLFDPATRIDEGVDPHRDIIVAARAGIVSALPGVDSALEVGHHRYMATVSRCKSGYGTL